MFDQLIRQAIQARTRFKPHTGRRRRPLITPATEPQLQPTAALLAQHPDVVLWPTAQVAIALRLPAGRATEMRVARILYALGLRHRRVDGDWVFVRTTAMARAKDHTVP